MKKLMTMVAVALVGTAALSDNGYLYWAVDQSEAQSPIAFAYARIKTSDGSWTSQHLVAPGGSAISAGPVNSALGDRDLSDCQFVVQLLNDAYDVVGVTDEIGYAVLAEHIFDGMSEAGASPYLATEFAAEEPGCEGNPWEIGGDVTAWVDPALTNLAAVVIDNGLPTATNAIDLVALTNNMAMSGYEPLAAPFNALVAVGKDDGGEAYVKPVNWLDAGNPGTTYETLAEALAAGVTTVVPNFSNGAEVPAEIVETVTGEDGKTYTAALENTQPEPGVKVENPVKASEVEGLTDVATNEQKNVTLKVETKDAAEVDDKLKAAAAGYDSVAFVDLSVFFDEEKQDDCELNSLITIHIPWPVRTGGAYGVVRMHIGEPQVIPEGADKAVGGEFFTVDFEKREIVLRVKKFSDYAVAETPPGEKVGENAYMQVDDGKCTIFGTGSATNLPSGFDRDSITNAVVADGITEIGARFFKNFNNLNAVTFGKDVAKFGEKAFLYCMSLESIEIGNPDFDLSSLDGAISYHTAIKPDGSLYPIPNVTVNGCQQTLEGKAALTDANWADLGAVDPGKPMEDYTGYHFFRIVLKKIEE